MAGTVDLSAGSDEHSLREIVDHMTGCLVHRGPDDSGSWIDVEAGIALGHRRLSVVDLSPLAHQPMVSRDGRFVLTYNGEVYNHRVVRTRLESQGIRFRSHSDTEVLLEAIARWGVRGALREFSGMWAFALYDRDARRLTLACDRFGEKPLYVGWNDRWLYFASELKSLRRHAHSEVSVDRASLASYFRHGWVPAPASIYEGVWRLPGGTMLELDLTNGRPAWEPQRWWDLGAIARHEVDSRRERSVENALERLEVALSESVSLRVVADVPVGAFLSGGVDSSLVVALMAEQADAVHTFTIGFDEASFDEAPFAMAIAERLGTTHTEMRVTSADVRDVIPTLPDVYDEPFADSSQLPTTLLAALARRHVTVALTGDGGDEFFAGYARYGVHAKLQRAISVLPDSARRALAKTLLAMPDHGWTHIGNGVGRVVPAARRHARLADRVQKLAGVLTAPNADDAYLAIISAWDHPEELLLNGCGEVPTVMSQELDGFRDFSVVERAQLADQLCYLPNDLLTKVDRAAMAAGLETRLPLLDEPIARLAWSVPSDVHHADGRGKYLLRRLLARRLPAELVDRPKQGFAVPIGDWLRGPLRPWAEDLLSPQRLSLDGFLRTEVITKVWREHLAGVRNRTPELWAVLMWQAWSDRWLRT